MPNLFVRLCPWLALAVFTVLLPTGASAQDRQDSSSLRLPTIAASAAAAADWATTYHALKYYKVREMNPVLRPLEKSPGSLISVGGMIDAGSISAWNLAMGRKHPKVAAGGLWAMTAFRAYLAIHNLRNIQRAERK